jgi:hypothetical protein
VYRQTHRRGVVCTDRLTGEGDCVQIDSQWRGSVYRQTHRGGVVCRQTHRGGVVCTDRLTGEE